MKGKSICLLGAVVALVSNLVVGNAVINAEPQPPSRRLDVQSKPTPIRPAEDAPQPMTPDQSVAKMRLPQGFRIELVASEPVVQDPSCIAFDEHGRIFVCELHGYNIEGHLDVQELNKTGVLDQKVRRLRWEFQDGRIAEEAAKRQYGVVKMLVDTNADGVMDKAEVWAEDLPPCYGVVPARGGIIAVCAPDIVFLADRDGDGKPEIRETLFTGFRSQTIERGINNPRWGLDNWIYVGAGGSGGTITGINLAEPVELTHSDFRIKSDGSAIEPVTGRVGTFGMTSNDIGDRFPSTGGRPAMYALPLPHRYLTRNPHVPTPETNYSAATYNRGYRISQPHPWRVKRQQDPAWVKFYGPTETNSHYFSGGCSNEFYGDTLFAQQFQGNIFYCEPSLNIVHRCIVKRDGAGYQGRRADGEQQSEFLASTDQWFRPMNLRVGPEGALYIVDMYREIIEDYSAIPRFLQQQYGLNKGGDHGRIWRLVPESFVSGPLQDLSKFKDAELSRATAASQSWRRFTAQRLLIERKAATEARTLSTQLRDAGTHQACIHALHTLEGLGTLRSSDVSYALQHEHYGVRLHALRLSERWLDEGLLHQVMALADDRDPAVRLQVAMTIGETRDPKAVDALLKLSTGHGSEKWMASAILSSSGDRAEELLIGLLKEGDFSDQALPLLRPLSATIAGRRDASAMSRTLSTVGKRAKEIQFECLSGFVDGLSRGSETIPESSDGWASLVSLLKSDTPSVRELATNLASKLQVADDGRLKAIFATAAKQAVDETLSVQQRRQAMKTLTSAPYDVIAPLAATLLDARQPVQIQLDAVEAMGSSVDERVGSDLLDHWSSYTPTVRKAVMTAILARVNRLPALLTAIENKRIDPSEISEITREQLTTSQDEVIASRAKRLLTNPKADAELQLRFETYRSALSRPRNVESGKQVFDKNCLNCHKVGDEQGHDVGPHLGTILNRPDETLLMDILDPSGRIEPEFRSYIVMTDDGRTVSGILASESPTSVTLRQEKAETLTILRRDIELIKASSVSLMPSNLHEQIAPNDAADLIAFMRATFGAKAQQANRVSQLRKLGATVFTRGDSVVEVNANGTRITDGHLKTISAFGTMTDLSLEGTNISDAGVSHLSELQKLEWLNLYRCPVGDAGLRELRQLRSLQHLPIGGSKVTDAGLRHLSQMRQLVYLGLRGNNVTDDGVKQLSKLTKLTGLHLGETKVTDLGLGHLQGLQKLQRLWLDDADITDEAIKHLVKLRSLSELHIRGTKMTSEGIKRLQRSLPKCQIESTVQ